MLPLFEEQTQQLTPYEMDVLIPKIIHGLSLRIGACKAVTNKEMVEGLRKNKIEVTDARIRKCINYIRNNDLLPGLVSSSKGYWITTDSKEVQMWIDSLKGRELAIRSIRVKAENYLTKLKIS